MKIYGKFWPYLKPHLWLLTGAFFCMLVSSLLEGVSLGMFVPLIDVVLLNKTVALPAWVPADLVSVVRAFEAVGPLQKLNMVVVTAIILFTLKNITIFGQTYLMADVAMRFLRDIRDGLYRHYQSLSLDYFGGERTGDLVSRITYDVSVLHNTITEGISDLVYNLARVTVMMFIIVKIDWRLAFIVLVLVPAIGYPMVRIGKVLRKLGIISQQKMADINSHLIEKLQGMRIVKAFTAEEKEAARFAEVNQDYYKANIKTVKRREALSSVTELIGITAGFVVLEIGGRSVLENQLSLGTVIFFLGALLSLLQPVKKLSRLHSVNQQALVAAKRVAEVLDTKPAVETSPDAVELPRFSREIRFEEVWFKYQDRYVLEGLNLTVRAGEVVGIVGSSGAGKTTLLNLIPRFYDPTRGRVAIDGIDIRRVTLKSLRSQIGLVTQDPFLFHDTVRANIAFGWPEATLEQVTQAARIANADTFIQRLPNGYDTPVGELGTRLSGGERQRIAIARAVLKDPPILLLDEATSQLDSESEALVQEALERLMSGRTTFVVSHRFSTIRGVDRIIVLDGGRVAETGRHDDLLRESPLYKRLYELQVAR